ncbi:MAG TPA: glycosyltransferase family 39 protein [Vicinamibacterales bacterium]|nr:glycosyltransferase family 39 protein [Vicinamibacterales bacterium]
MIAVVGAGLLLAAAAVFGAGMSTSVGGMRVSARTLFRPVVIAVSAALIASWRSKRREQQFTNLWIAVQRHATGIVVCVALVVFTSAMRTSLFEARASDQYGYVSQAALWSRGDLVVPQPLAAAAPWPNATWTFSPLGYRPGQRPATIVPTYPPGLPLIMAGFITLVGPFGAFIVVPLLGVVAIVATFFLGRRIAGPAGGLLAAMLLSTSPIFLYQMREPMSDVPVTAWWLLATLLIATPSPARAFGGGLAASAAIMTRPNLVPLAAVLGIFVLGYASARLRTRLVNGVAFASGVLPGCVALALVNRSLYGSAFESGYGSTAELFKLEYLGANLSNYPRWLVETETPLILLAFAAPWCIRTPRTWLFIAISAALFASYAFYLPFDNWTYLRFLLPAISVLLILTAAVLLHLSQRLPSRSARWLAAAACVVVMAWRWDSAGMQPPPPNERRFAVVGEFVRDGLPENAILLSMQHSGSLRYYSGRQTLRWDLLEPEWLERSLTFLREQGYRPLILLEDWEQPLFTQRFAGHTKVAALDWRPMATYSGEIRTDIFDPADQARSDSAPTRPIDAR